MTRACVTYYIERERERTRIYLYLCASDNIHEFHSRSPPPPLHYPPTPTLAPTGTHPRTWLKNASVVPTSF